jgi:hypothetical protein
MAKIIHIIRDYPENGVKEMDIQEQDLVKLQGRGWRVAEPAKESVKEPAKEQTKEPVKEAVKETSKKDK